VLDRRDPLEDLLWRTDGLCSLAAGGERVGKGRVRGVKVRVLLVSLDGGETRVVPFEVVVLSRRLLVVEEGPPLLRLLFGLGAVHPQQGGGLDGGQTQTGPELVELPELAGHVGELVARPQQPPPAVLVRQRRRA